jgi:hypothetical protein
MIMNGSVSFVATPTTKPSRSSYAVRPIALWALTAVLVAFACAALALDATMTQEQRIAVLTQSGMFP